MTIDFTPSALTQLEKLASEHAPDEGITAKLQLSVQGGGCSGLTYKWDWLDKYPGTNHHALTISDKLDIVVDQKSGLFLDGMKLDYSDGLNGKGFEFHNPNAKRTCGCGSSFGA